MDVRRRRLLALLSVAALLAGCGGGQDPDDPGTDAATAAPSASAGPSDPVASAGPGAEAVSITIADFAYEVPASVPAGAELTVTNEDDVGHTVTSDEEGVFDVAVGPGETVTLTAPAEADEYGFFCIPHPHMTATLVVR